MAAKHSIVCDIIYWHSPLTRCIQIVFITNLFIHTDVYPVWAYVCEGNIPRRCAELKHKCISHTHVAIGKWPRIAAAPVDISSCLVWEWLVPCDFDDPVYANLWSFATSEMKNVFSLIWLGFLSLWVKLNIFSYIYKLSVLLSMICYFSIGLQVMFIVRVFTYKGK